ncbi:MAG TPA: alpha-L-fucosidase C-terminal domain-containing protein [Sedimentisphaerales bacterium]|nr:alpha-L-fucosidase C-terminal domain-containing protein [Sedimentisphaerales bacterium]
MNLRVCQRTIEFETFGSNINQFIRQCVKEVDSSIGAAIAYSPAEDNIWFTKKRDANILYAIALEWPGEKLTIESLRDTKVLSVKMLGLNKEMKWQQSKEGLVIETSDERPSKYAYTFKIVCLHL